MRLVIYARYSSDLQRDASIDDQVRVCRVRAEREQWTVTGVYTDHAISGATTLRPGYQALLANLRAGSVDIILAESLDRISRDQEHIAAFFKQATFAGVRIVTLAEGDISELHIGLKGTMGALYLKDLAQKTHRGIEGRIRQGRSFGHAPYGYEVVRVLGTNGELDRGLRRINPAQAAVVRRIYEDYVAGVSPRRIAQHLNAEQIPGPSGGIWYDASIRGRPNRGDGLLRNQTYIGRLVWNRTTAVTDPVTGTRHRRRKSASDVVQSEVPELRIVTQCLWDRAQMRLAQETAPPRTAPADHQSQAAGHAFWLHRRPKHLLTGKVACGLCGALFATVGQDYLGCRNAHQGACQNRRRVRRGQLETQVMDVLGRQLMDPDLTQSFVAAFTQEWNSLLAEQGANSAAKQRELERVQHKIHNLIDAISDGIRSTDMQKRLAQLEARRAELQAESAQALAPLPALHPNLAIVYRQKVADLKDALRQKEATEALEAARALIDQIIISPPENDDDPPRIEVIGELTAMLNTAGIAGTEKTYEHKKTDVTHAFARSVKAASGGKAPGRRRQRGVVGTCVTGYRCRHEDRWYAVSQRLGR